MELALSLGDTPKSFSFLEKSQKILGKDLGFCMAVDNKVSADGENNGRNMFSDGQRRYFSSDPPVQLDLLPFSPVHRSQPSPNKFPFHWLNEKLGAADLGRPGLKINRKLGDETDQDCPSLSSPNTTSTVSSFQMDLSIFGSSARENKRDFEQINNNNNNNNNNNCENEADIAGTSSRGSDEEENGLMARKKLRLSKEQSAFLEESFREHNTLNPKQKLALAKQLNLRPRQVEVWFQNRRARTKLKQTEVDCDYLKKWCETLTEENKRLQKELQELRALKASQPYYMQHPATTLTMCPSCERVATAGGVSAPATSTTTAAAVVVNNKPSSKHFSLSSCHHYNAQQAAS